MQKTLKINLNIFYGDNSLKKLINKINDYNFKNPYLICDKNLKDILYISKNTNYFKNKKFISFQNEPTYQMLNKEIKEIKKIKKIDCFVAIGGGSTIDFTKGISTLYKNKGNALKFMGFPKNLNDTVPVIAIPTTVSTGSEVIYNAVFIDKISNTKLGINTERNYPILSILDPKLISLAPKKIIYQSAIASLMRSIETYTSPDSDEITKYFSKKSYDLIANAFTKKRTKDFYKDLQWGCVFSMIALSNSSSGPCGIINYYLSTYHNISQPFSYSFTSLEFIKHNIKLGFYGYGNLIDNNKLSNKKKSLILLNKLLKIQNTIKNHITNTKHLLFDKEKISNNIFNIFKKKKFIPLTKNPIRINKNDLRTIINKIIK